MKKGSYHTEESLQKNREHNSGKSNGMYGKTNELCPAWKGDAAGVNAIHRWVERRKVKPALCENCNQREPKELANISGEYRRDVDDYLYLCMRCHLIFDDRWKHLQNNKPKDITITKKRVVWTRNYSDLAKKRMESSECPNCGLHKSQWIRKMYSARCCSKKCSEEFYKGDGAVLDWKEIRKDAFKRDNNTCAICKKKFDESNLIGDHIVPIAVGGNEFDLSNVQTLCIDCNKSKTKLDAGLIARYRRYVMDLKSGSVQAKLFDVPVRPDERRDVA